MTSSTTAPKERTYVLPNSSTENSRLDSQHILLTTIYGGLHLSPLSPPRLRRTLDIGAGTCNWSIDFANQYPQTQVLAFDIEEKPGKPDPPPNLAFQLADLSDAEFWASIGEFDYIHARLISPSVKDWQTLIQRCSDHLAPGGYLELQDLHFPIRAEDSLSFENSKLIKWSRHMIPALKSVGLDFTIAAAFSDMYRSVGLEDVQFKTFRELTGPWDKSSPEAEKLGKLGQENVTNVIPAVSESVLKKYMDWDEETYRKFVAEVIEEVWEGKYTTWLPMIACYGRKPE